jgi:methyl coenzyme M reductase gamma subunit
MHFPSKAVRVSLLSVTLCLALSTIAFSIEKEVYDKPQVQQPGRTIHGKVVKVVERDVATHKWDVSVENGETGEVVPLHLDKTTARKETDKNPAVGDKVIVKYDENSKHALSFVADSSTSN